MTDFFLGLNPVLITKVKVILGQMAAAGHPMRPCQGVRTAEYQHNLYLQGRDSAHPGRIVTNCDGYKVKSRHQAAQDGLGRAIDCCFEGLDPFGIKQPWRAYGAFVEAQGLTWGGRFKLVDLDHAELP